MNELKDTFVTAATNEPPLLISVESIIHGGRARQRRRSMLAAVSGAAVAAMAVTVVLAVPRHSPGPGGQPGAEVSLSPTATPATPTPTPATPTPTPTHEPLPGETLPAVPTVGPPSPGLLDTPHVLEVTASMQRKSASMVAALTRELESNGYTVSRVDNRSDFLPDTDGGNYDYLITISKDGRRGELSISSGSQPTGPLLADPTRDCQPDMYACSVVTTAGGGTARFNSDNKETHGAHGRHVVVWWSGVITQAQYFLGTPTGADVKVPDALLLSLATNPSLDLKDVLRFTLEEVKSFGSSMGTATPPEPMPTRPRATKG